MGEAEKFWFWRLKFEELATDGKQGMHDLDDFQSARFLEAFGDTMTVLERRKVLKEIDLDSNNRMGMLESLVYKYKPAETKPPAYIKELMNRPQGTNEAVKNAEKALKAVMAEIEKIEKKEGRIAERYRHWKSCEENAGKK